MATTTADVIIIGGGVIGASIAWHLSQKNIQVLLLEKDIPAAGSSGACDGAVLLQSKKPGIHLKLAQASITRFPRLAEELPYPIHFKNNGSIVVVQSEKEMEIMRGFTEKQNRHGLKVDLLEREPARELEPALSENILGAAFSSTDGQINPIRLTLGFILGARNNGARVVTGEAVREIKVKNCRIESVITDRERYSAGMVVNATGALAPEIGKMVGIALPIKPRRGQILVTRAVQPMVRRCLLTANYIAAKFDPAIAKQGDQGVSIDQTSKGNFLLGSTREFVGYDCRTTLEGMAGIARRAAQVIPGLARLEIIRSFAGLRPYTPDGLPILGYVDGIENFIMAAGHEGDGIALSPITGELIAQMIANEPTELPLDDFRFNRFSAPAERSAAQ
jgi:glycine/D-amino acid oxidase-like deaminating enzyme